MDLNLELLAKFLVKAKVNTYAGDSKEIIPQRPAFRELGFVEGDWEYRDSYSGFYSAPGQEIVCHKGFPVWNMAYNGGMLKEYHGDFNFSKKTFEFLKKAIKLVGTKRPFRGPEYFKEGNFEYFDKSEGDITNFRGTERILYNGKKVFEQDYIGGLIVPK